MNSSNIQVVLVNPSHPGNIGAVARAMKNMGLRQLVLVDPRKFPDPEAEWRAASALDIIQAARVVETLDEAIADSQFVVGTSARERRIPWNPPLSSASPHNKLAVSNRLVQCLHNTRCLNDVQRTRGTPLSLGVGKLAGVY